MEANQFDFSQETLDRANRSLMESEHRGVPGVQEFRGEVAGPSDPVLYIGTHTHGDEPGSGAIVPALISGQVKVGRGRVIVGVNNLDAAREGKRFLKGGLNFNRLPADDMLAGAHANNASLDFQRMRALARAGLLEATHGLDLHTIPHSPVPGFKLHEKGDYNFANAIGIEDFIAEITNNQFDSENPAGPKTVAFGNYIGGLENNIPVAEIEGGGPETPAVRRTVAQGTLSVMAQLGMIDPSRYGLEPREIEQRLYTVTDWAWAPAGYTLARQFEPYARMQKGEPVMVDSTGAGRPDIVAPRDGHLIMPPPFGKPLAGPDDWWHSAPVEVSRQKVL
ncbi:MAG: hypothetical protein AAB383_01545 [Patescibacteria group bacterium]